MFHGKHLLPGRGQVSVGAASFTLAILVFLIATRWPLAPRYLYYFDSANFALAIEEFDPALHQPQPPGYPLFVAFLRLVHVFVEAPERVLLIAGIFTALLATVLIRLLATDLFGRAAGYLAAVLLASDPVFWFAGVTNQVRLCLSVTAAGIGWLAWRALTRPDRPAWLYAAFAALGIAAGFRPVAGGLLFPLLLWVWWRTGHSPRRLVIGGSLLAATAAPWAAYTVYVVGGFARFWDMLSSYSNAQFSGTSVVFGAAAQSAYQMARWALVWTFLGALVWLWAVPSRIRSCFIGGTAAREKALFLSIGFLPLFLFSILIHIGDPDQALAAITILCVAGAGLLAAGRAEMRYSRIAAVSAVVVVLHAATFFYPPSRTAKAASYKALAAVDRMNNGALDAIHTLRRQGPLTIVHYGSSVATRHLYYYFPDLYVVVLPGRPGRPAQAAPEVFYQREVVPLPEGASGLIGRGSRKVVFLLPWDAKPDDLPGARRFGAVYYYDRAPGTTITVGPHKLIPASSVTTSSAAPSS